jgi:hypothetical protein
LFDEPEICQDLALIVRIEGGRQADNRRPRAPAEGPVEETRDGFVGWAEIIPPLLDAMCFIHGHQPDGMPVLSQDVLEVAIGLRTLR